MLGQGMREVGGARRVLGRGVGGVEDRTMLPSTTRRRITIQL